MRAQFGEKVALYYAFNCFYTWWLVPPSLVGGVLWLSSWWLDPSYYAQWLPVFACAIMVWASAFIKAWQRKQNRLAMEWGTISRIRAEVVRKGYYGIRRISPITNESEVHYPRWRRALKCVHAPSHAPSASHTHLSPRWDA